MAEKKSKAGNKKLDKDEENVFKFTPDRLVALTDGVFAITMTLLVLELIPEEIWGHPEAGQILYSYALGFFSLGVFWALHHYIFHFIERSNGVLVWLNIMFLAASSLTPFWTQVLVEPEEYVYGWQFYGISMIFIMITLLIIWYYATDKKRLVKKDFDGRMIFPLYNTIIIGIFLLAIAIIAGLINETLGYIIFAPAVFFLIVTVYGPHKIFKIK
ncbi:MAG: DUF1211 domain-containing protein [Thermoplasmata archaeon]|nr:MAG: DUF1211 domain-containing protein [Thermoplasmata archaeon]